MRRSRTSYIHFIKGANEKRGTSLISHMSGLSNYTKGKDHMGGQKRYKKRKDT